jgi:hypothetical protein
MLMNKNGVSAYNDVVTQNGNPNEYKLKSNWSINTAGTAMLELKPGNILSKNSTATAGTGYLLTGGSLFAGGSTIVNGTASQPVTIKSTGNRLNYIALMSDFVYYPTKFWANYMNLTGSSTGGSLYTSGVFSNINVYNSNIENTYDAAGGYTLRAMYSERQQDFKNTTFYHSCNGAGCAYNIYLYTVTDTQLNLIDCRIINKGTYSGDQAIYSANIYQNWIPNYIGVTFKNNVTEYPLNVSHVNNAFQNGYFGMGNLVNPTITDLTGNPIANATITITPQFHEWEDETMYMHGYDTNDPMRWSYYATAQIYGAFDKLRTAITDSNGKATDSQGTTSLYMMDGIYYSITKNRIVNYGGNRTDLRQFGYTWLNDGSDYGYILTVTAENYSGIQRVIPSNQTFNETIILTQSGPTSSSSLTSCLNSTHQQTQYIDPITNSTTSYSITSCAYGCSAGACNQPVNDFAYVLLVIASLIGAGFGCLYVIRTLGDDSESLKMLFFFLALFLFIAAMLATGIIGEKYQNEILGLAKTLSGIAFVLLGVVSFLLMLFAIKWIVSTLELIKK